MCKKAQSDRYCTATELLRDLRRIKFSREEGILEDTRIIESPTQIIPKVKNEDVNTIKKRKKKGKKENKEDGGLKVVFLAILLAFIVVSSMALGFFKLKDFFITPEVPVPDLIGMQEEVAKKEIEDLGLNFKVGKRVHDSEFKEGEIVFQKTEPGEKVKKGYTIEVTVSKGSNLVKVPNLINKNISEIDEILRDTNLSEVVDYKYSDTVEANRIIDQSPEPYSEVEEGTKISLIVSQGPEKKLVVVPKLVGQKEKDAENALIVSQLVRGRKKKEPSNEYPEGYVIWQSIEPGTQIESNTEVDIYVSSGPEEKPEEQDNNNKEIPFSINVTPAQDRDETEIRVDRIQDGVRESVYNKVHKAEEETVKIPLKGKLDAQFEFYYDGQLIETIPHPGR